jgi:hypothetical protein
MSVRFLSFKSIAIVLCLTTCAAASWWATSAFGERARTPKKIEDVTSSEIEELKQQVGQLARAVRAQPKPELNDAPIALPPPSATSEVARPAETISELVAGLEPEERRYRLEVVREAMVKMVKDTYDQEQQDPEWSAPARQLLQNAFQGPTFEGLELGADCRSSMCRMSLKGDDGTKTMQAMKQVVEGAPWPGQGMTRYDPQSGTAEVYLAREGEVLPDIDLTTLRF